MEAFATCLTWLARYLGKLPSHFSDHAIEFDDLARPFSVLATHFSLFTNYSAAKYVKMVQQAAAKK